MQRLCLSRQFEQQLFTNADSNTMTSLSYIRIDDADHIIAVFSDDTEMDVTTLFSESVIDDYRAHDVLIRC